MIEDNSSLEEFLESLRSLFGIPNEIELGLQRRGETSVGPSHDDFHQSS